MEKKVKNHWYSRTMQRFFTFVDYKKCIDLSMGPHQDYSKSLHCRLSNNVELSVTPQTPGP